MKPTTQYATAPSEEMDMEKLGWVVNEAVTAISSKTGLPESEVLDVLEKVRVELVGELKGVIQSLEDRGAIRNVDTGKLSAAIEGAIEAISDAIGLDTDEITEVFTKEEGASLDHIVFRLCKRSRIDRSNHV